jgi:hypothetical protein
MHCDSVGIRYRSRFAAIAAIAAVALCCCTVLLHCAVATATTVFSNRQHVRVGMCERGIHVGLKKPSQAS